MAADRQVRCCCNGTKGGVSLIEHAAVATLRLVLCGQVASWGAARLLRARLGTGLVTSQDV